MERGGNLRTRHRAYRVDRSDGLAGYVLVVVDEDFAGPFGDVPYHCHIVGVGGGQHPANGFDEAADPAIAVTGVDRNVDVQAGGSRRLGVSAQAQTVKGHFEVAGQIDDLLPGGALSRVEIEDGEVRVIDGCHFRKPRMDFDAAHVGEPHQRWPVGRGAELDWSPSHL